MMMMARWLVLTARRAREFVVNGSFAADTDWTHDNGGVGTSAIAGEVCTLTGSSTTNNRGGIKQQLNGLVSGKTYRIRGTFVVSTGSVVFHVGTSQPNIATSSFSNNLYNSGVIGVGTTSIDTTFTAGATNWISAATSGNASATADDISVYG